MIFYEWLKGMNKQSTDVEVYTTINFTNDADVSDGAELLPTIEVSYNKSGYVSRDFGHLLTAGLSNSWISQEIYNKYNFKNGFTINEVMVAETIYENSTIGYHQNIVSAGFIS